MNSTLGSGGSLLTFNTPAQTANWYTDISYPTGASDASIAAGAYGLNMYFSSLPGGTGWWNSSYLYRQQVTVTAGTTAVPTAYSVRVQFDHQGLVAGGKSLSSGNDIRVVYWNGSGWVEPNRLLDDQSSWNSTTTQVWFRTQAAINASASDTNYYIYYGNSGAGSPPATWSNVFLFYDDFNDGSFDTARWTCEWGSCSESGGNLTIVSGSAVWGPKPSAIGPTTTG